MIFKRLRQRMGANDQSAGGRLGALVREHLPEADEDTRRLVVAVTGLLASVAYADREYHPGERGRVRESLERVDGLSREGVETICATLDQHIVEIASVNTQGFTRDLRELADRSVRLEVLDVLLDLAAADGALSLSETDLLRRTTSAMGLTQDDYLHAQARHRDRLSILK